MLKKLYIQNYALIDKLDLSFNSGLNVITGETGAGKSIIIGALGLILGNRADSSAVKNQKSKCIVEGIFDSIGENVVDFLKYHELDIESELFLRREISTSGKSRAFINDTPVSLAQLKELAILLVDVNAQNQTYIFKEPLHQLEMLDSLADNKELLNEYKIAYQDFVKQKKELGDLQAQEKEAIAQKDFLEFQFNELADMNLKANEDENIKAELDILNNSEAIKSQLFIATQALSESEGSIIEQLEGLLLQINGLSSFQGEYKELYERLKSTLLEIQDIANEYANLNEEADFDPQYHSELLERMDQIIHLQQKHHKNDVNELIEFQNDLDNQLQSFVSIGEDIIKKEKELAITTKNLDKLSNQLSKKRKKSIPSIEKNIVISLQDLGMKDVVFKIDMQKLSDFTSSGTDTVNFLFSSNKGHQPDLISKIASGGELSRLVLSLKSLLSASKSLPTVIFDEIDTGVSGDIASKVGQTMKYMSNNMQVIAITHLHQIAAKADWHFKVYKKEVDNKTLSDIRQLKSDERLGELALMISGDSNSNQALKMAEELLKN
jgi:DNA repair protein RecN (Recombination protein N)